MHKKEIDDRIKTHYTKVTLRNGTLPILVCLMMLTGARNSEEARVRVRIICPYISLISEDVTDIRKD